MESKYFIMLVMLFSLCFLSSCENVEKLYSFDGVKVKLIFSKTIIKEDKIFIYGVLKIKNISQKKEIYNRLNYLLKCNSIVSSPPYVDSYASILNRNISIEPRGIIVDNLYWVLNKSLKSDTNLNNCELFYQSLTEIYKDSQFIIE